MRKTHKELLHARAYRYTVLFEHAPEGGNVATIPVLGIATQGETLQETRTMARDAIRALIESLSKDGEEIPTEQPAAITERLAVSLPARP
jgi:predicted RNase H-like HicB family nuclease